MRLQEVLVTVLGQKSHKLIIGPVLDDSERGEERRDKNEGLCQKPSADCRVAWVTSSSGGNYLLLTGFGRYQCLHVHQAMYTDLAYLACLKEKASTAGGIMKL